LSIPVQTIDRGFAVGAWYKITIETESRAEELVTSILHESGTKGIELITLKNYNHLKIISYFDQKPDTNLIGFIAKGLISGVFDGPVFFNISSEKAEEKDWVKIQADTLGIVMVTDKIWIIPPWKKNEAGEGIENRIQILINPGSAFGTGEHPTTKGCIEALEKNVEKGDVVLDIGAGSGILGIAALKFGALRISAIEIDGNAASNGIGNFDLNSYSDCVEWHTGTIRTFETNTKFDVIAANIFSHVILNDAKWIRRFGKKDTRYIFSGILYEGSSDFLSEMSLAGYSLVDTYKIGEWMTFVMEDKG
jgi:ribosomal protein L11 methyltransferase